MYKCILYERVCGGWEVWCCVGMAVSAYLCVRVHMCVRVYMFVYIAYLCVFVRVCMSIYFHIYTSVYASVSVSEGDLPDNRI